MTELLVGTRKGLFVLEGEPGAEFEITTRAFVGEPVDYAMRDPRTGRLFAAVTSPFWGPRIWFTDDLARRVAAGARRRAAQGRRRRAQAHLGDRRRRGRRPAVRRRRSRRAVREPRRRRDVGAQPRAVGAPDAAALAARLRRPVGALDRAVAGRPAAPRARDLRGRRLADRRRRRDVARTATRGSSPTTCPRQARATAIDLCVHHLERAPRAARAAVPAVSRRRLPLRRRGRVVDRHRRRACRTTSAFPSCSTRPIPTARTSSRSTTADRVTDGARRSSGRRATPARRGRRATTGLPQATPTCRSCASPSTATGEGDALELYFGATSGEIFGSARRGRSWFGVAQRLPAIASVRVGRR